MIARELLAELEQCLAGGEGARIKARVLFETVTGADARGYEGEVPEADAETARALAERVCGGYPVQYVAGSWPFMDFEVQVGEGVLIPRDDTVALVEAAGSLAPAGAACLDLCAGTGVVGIALARRYGMQVTAVEKYYAAFEYLKVNSSVLAPRNTLVQADILHYQDELADGAYRLIVSNPPYLTEEEYAAAPAELAFEPKAALVGGLDYHRHIIGAYRRCLAPGGAMALEIGSTQAGAVAELFRSAGYTDIRVVQDLQKNDRVVTARIESEPELCYNITDRIRKSNENKGEPNNGDDREK